MSALAPSHPIYCVRENGKVDRLGEWVHAERRLVLEQPGFPFLQRGEHRLEGELPWILWDMAPSGYLGRQFVRRLPELSVGRDPGRWTSVEALAALSGYGQELAGNLLVGDGSLARFRAWQFDGRDAARQLDALLSEVFAPGEESSLGGERPKLLGSSYDGSGYLMKFSPPPTTPQGVRWSDLLRMEAHCAAVLRFFGIAAVQAKAGTTRGRTTLHVPRFDRRPNRGRVGAATLYWLAMDLLGSPTASGPEVVAALVANGQLPPDATSACDRVHAFSAAIGNTDAHLGNYGLLFDSEGRARLAPFYDILPMALAPRHDELPDEHIVPRTTPVDGRVQRWVERLVNHLEADSEITDGFKDLWRRLIGA